MPKVYTASDHHFNHKRILEFQPVFRPFKDLDEHNEALVRLHNEVVTPEDTVWFLGDVLFGVDSFKYIERMHGIKNLVLGNHDHYDLGLYQAHFLKIAPCFTIKGVLLSHMPVHPSQIGYRYKGNVHGHLHSKTLNDPRYFNVSVERIGLKPILLDKVVAGFPELNKVDNSCIKY